MNFWGHESFGRIGHLVPAILIVLDLIGKGGGEGNIGSLKRTVEYSEVFKGVKIASWRHFEEKKNVYHIEKLKNRLFTVFLKKLEIINGGKIGFMSFMGCRNIPSIIFFHEG